MFPSAYLGYKFYEPAPNYTLIGFGAVVVNALTINNKTLARLPDDVVNIIKEVGREYEVKSGVELDAKQAAALDGLRKNGTNVRQLPKETRAEWAAALTQFPNKQAAEADKRGLPGTEVINAYIGAISATGYQWLVPYSVN